MLFFSPYTLCLLFRTDREDLNISDPLLIYGCAPSLFFSEEYVLRMHHMTKGIRNCKRETWCQSLDWPGRIGDSFVETGTVVCRI